MEGERDYSIPVGRIIIVVRSEDSLDTSIICDNYTDTLMLFTWEKYGSILPLASLVLFCSSFGGFFAS